jgi:hypothetical protein
MATRDGKITVGGEAVCGGDYCHERGTKKVNVCFVDGLAAELRIQKASPMLVIAVNNWEPRKSDIAWLKATADMFSVGGLWRWDMTIWML